MKQISTKEIVDLFAYNKDSAVLVEKRPLPGNAQYKVNYSVVNFATGEQEVITKSAYLLAQIWLCIPKNQYRDSKLCSVRRGGAR